MKSLSASIVVLSGAIMIAVGSTIDGYSQRSGVLAPGWIVGLIGLIVWLASMSQPDGGRD